MIDHYNAFISYKHAPEDNKVAEAIQKGLEHFKIPSAIKKKTGMKRIQRIFRDKDELPITSDLSETISHALEHSDYLIVICSTNTKESIWVQREIEYFLRTHTKRQILTVLVNGEPEEVIPPILLYEDRVALNQAGQQQVFRMPLEPLSCDYRMPHYKAHRVELPRLASALIGCSYDELMNRRRLYRVKQTVAAFAAVLALFSGFTVYNINRKNQIQANYMKALENQSKYLANASQDLLDREQRITALQLALEALPKDENDERPITPEAIRALSKASLAYVTEKTTNVKSEWIYGMANDIDGFEVSPDGHRFVLRDDTGKIKVWDTISHKEVLRLGSKNHVFNGFKIVSDTEMVAWEQYSLQLYDISNSEIEEGQSAEPKWTYDLTEKYFKSVEPVISEDGFMYIMLSTEEMVKINLSDGTLVKTYDLSKLVASEGYAITEMTLSPNGKLVGFVDFGMFEYLAGMVNVESGETVTTDVVNGAIKDICFADDGHFLYTNVPSEEDTNVDYGLTEILKVCHANITCLDTTDFSEVWSADFDYSDIPKNSGFEAFPDKNEVLYYRANKSVVYDVKTGNVKYNHNVNSPLVLVCDADGDGSPSFITQDGSLGSPFESNGTDSLVLSRYFSDDIDEAIINGGIYVKEIGAKEVIFYGTSVHDKNWKELSEGLVLPDFFDKHYMDENVLAITTSKDNNYDNKVITLFDLNDSCKMSQAEVKLENGKVNKVLGTWEGKLYIAYDDDDEIDLISIDISSGKVEHTAIDGKFTNLGLGCSMSDGKMVLVCHTGTDQKDVIFYDIKTGKSETFHVPENNGFPMIAPEIYGDYIYYTCEEDLIINTTNGNSVQVDLPEDWVGTQNVEINQSGDTFALSDGNNVILVDMNGQQICQMVYTGAKPLGMYFYSKYGEGEKEMLLVFYDDGSLGRYNITDGSMIGKSESSIYFGENAKTTFIESNDKSQIYIYYDDRLNIIDTSSWLELTSVENCLGYNAASNRFFTCASPVAGENHIGYFNRYTDEELIAKARGIVGDSELSPELKNEYGLED